MPMKSPWKMLLNQPPLKALAICPIQNQLVVMMNWLIWNCRGAGKRNFANLIKDCKRMYNLGFLAILEPRIGGDKADKVIKLLGFDNVVKIDPIGFSGGIWCCWNTSHCSIAVVEVKRQCIHLQVDRKSVV